MRPPDVLPMRTVGRRASRNPRRALLSRLGRDALTSIWTAIGAVRSNLKPNVCRLLYFPSVSTICQ